VDEDWVLCESWLPFYFQVLYFGPASGRWARELYNLRTRDWRGEAWS